MTFAAAPSLKIQTLGSLLGKEVTGLIEGLGMAERKGPWKHSEANQINREREGAVPLGRQRENRAGAIEREI